MKVMDFQNSEKGRQRRRANNNRLLHCCCICGVVDTWGSSWSVFCSEMELDEERAVPKFCSVKCRNKGGLDASNVTAAMRQSAKDAEWREPRMAYRDATDIEKYRYAADLQKSRLASPPIASGERG